jgi:hypothetical protein
MRGPWARAGLFYSALTVAITFPLILHVGSVVPHDLGDPLLSTALLWWNAHALPLTERWWNGFAFFPATGTVAFSDHRLGESLLASPLLWLGVSPLAAYSVVLLATFPLCALAAHAVAFTLTKRHDAALLCGLAYGFNPYRAAHMSHLELLAAFGMPMALAALHQSLNHRRATWIAVFAIALFVQGLNSSYYLLFFSVFLALWIPWFVRGHNWTALPAIVAGIACAAAALSPLAIGYSRIHAQYALTRSFDEVLFYSADVTSFVTASALLPLWRWTNQLNPLPEQQLFAGLTISALAVVGLATAIYRHRADDDRWRLMSAILLTLSAAYVAIALALVWIGPWSVTVASLRVGATDVFKPISVALVFLVIGCAFRPWARAAWRGRSPLAFYLVATAVLFLCSLGPKPRFLGVQVLYKPPYDWLMNLPLFANSVRAPARFAMPGVLALSIAGSLAFNRLNLAVRARRFLAAILMAGIVADGWMGQLPVQAKPEVWQAPQGYRFGAVLELPLGEGAQDFLAMYRTIQSGRPAVNGHSGYFPLHYFVLQLAFSEKDPSVFDAVTPREEPLLIVLDKHADGEGRWNALITGAPRAIPLASDEHWAFFGIPPRQADTPCSGHELDIAGATDNIQSIEVSAWKDHDPKTAWISKAPQHAGDTVLIDLGREAHVCAIRMSIADSWFVYPRGLTVTTSADGITWAPVFTGSTAGLAIRGILENPKDIWIEVPVRPVATARVVKLKLDASHKSYPWFIPDLQVIGTR